MAYFKIVRKTLEINGSSRSTSIDLRAEVFSYDKNVSKFLFELTSKEAEIDLTGATVRVLLTYVGNDGKKGIIEDNGGVEAYTMNQIYYLLPEELRGYDGTVVMGLYVDLPSGEAIDIQNVQFRMFKSSIDDGAGVAGVVYFKSFEEWLFQVKEKALLEIQNIDDESERITEYADTKIKEYDDKFVQSNQKMSELQQSQIELSDQLNETNKKIDEADVYRKDEVFNKPESSANVIYQLIGKEEAEILITADFKEKITGSVVENPNIIRFSTNSTFMAPLTGSEPGQVYYDRAMTKDGVTLNVGNTNSDYMSQIQPNWNLVEIVDRTIPELFETVGLTDDSEIIEFIKNSVSYIKNTVDGVGTGLRRNRLTFKTYDSAGVLETEESVNDTAKIQELVREYADRATIKNMISDRGFLSALLFTEASDGVAVSQASLDYTKLEFKIKVSANLLIKLMIAANHIENLATEEEAETGEDNKKIMTPLRVMQSIKKFVENKFVSIAGNETIGGLKNFRDGLMVKENTVLTHKGVVTIKYSNADFPTEIASGYITFVRYGDEIQVVFNFKTRTDKDFAKDQSIIWGIAADFQADTSEPQYIGIASTGGTTSLVKFTANGATLTAHSTLTKDTWYAGTVTYLAKNKL